MIIPASALESETLRSIVEAYVLQEGTDYGPREFSLDEKVARVMHQIEKGEVVIVWSDLHQTVNLIPKSELSQQP